MTIKEIAEHLKLEFLTDSVSGDTVVNGGYTGDLLSDVMANSREGMLWITLQIHQNIIAVAKLKELAGIILINSRRPDEQTLKRAGQEGVSLLSSPENAFVISGRLFRLLEGK